MKNFKKLGFGFLCLCLMVSFNFISLAKENQEESISKGLKLTSQPLGAMVYEVKPRALNVRRGPGLSYCKIGKLHKGDQLIVYYDGDIADGYQWGEVVQVYIGGENLEGGYVAMDYLENIG